MRITVDITEETKQFIEEMENKKDWSKSKVANFLIEYAIRAMQSKKKVKNGRIKNESIK